MDARGRAHNAIEPGHSRCLKTVFGEVTVTRLAYRANGDQDRLVGPGDGPLPERLTRSTTPQSLHAGRALSIALVVDAVITCVDETKNGQDRCRRG